MTLASYQTLLLLYPPEHRALFGEEMISVFVARADECRKDGRFAFILFVLAESVALIFGAASEWFAKFTYGSRAAYCQPASQTSGAMAEAGMPGEICESQRRVELLISRMVYAIANHQFESARICAAEETKERARLHRLKIQHGLDL